MTQHEVEARATALHAAIDALEGLLARARVRRDRVQSDELGRMLQSLFVRLGELGEQTRHANPRVSAVIVFVTEGEGVT